MTGDADGSLHPFVGVVGYPDCRSMSALKRIQILLSIPESWRVGGTRGPLHAMHGPDL